MCRKLSIKSLQELKELNAVFNLLFVHHVIDLFIFLYFFSILLVCTSCEISLYIARNYKDRF